jgi:hypothetical protein
MARSIIVARDFENADMLIERSLGAQYRASCKHCAFHSSMVGRAALAIAAWTSHSCER